ncbi:MAG: signal peptidase II [Chthonomonadales bacterium]|nr:signal peptidase II [Chthonomonadales bacterium]
MASLRFYAVVAAIVCADQVSKWAVMGALTYGESRPIVPGWLSLTPTQNTGGAFSLLQARNGVFIVVALVAAAALGLAYHRFQRRDLWASAGIALALGGALGNLVDRMRLGYVQDFFNIHSAAGRNLWPVFNIADSAISVGILLLAWRIACGGPAAGADRRADPAPDAPEAPGRLRT